MLMDSVLLFGFAPFQLFLTLKRTRWHLVKAISQQLLSVRGLCPCLLDDLALLPVKEVVAAGEGPLLMLMLRTGSAIDLVLCGHVIRDSSKTNCCPTEERTGGVDKGHVNSQGKGI